MSIPVSAAMAGLREAAGSQGFALPKCTACGHRFYPPQSWCPRCLAPSIQFPKESGHATVLSTIRVHRSLDASWATRTPVYVSCVNTDLGVSVFALADVVLPKGTPVALGLSARAGEEGMFRVEASSRVSAVHTVT